MFEGSAEAAVPSDVEKVEPRQEQVVYETPDDISDEETVVQTETPANEDIDTSASDFTDNYKKMRNLTFSSGTYVVVSPLHVTRSRNQYPQRLQIMMILITEVRCVRRARSSIVTQIRNHHTKRCTSRKHPLYTRPQAVSPCYNRITNTAPG